MGAISLHRGNLHRHSDVPGRWPMPPRAISLPQFRHLLRQRNLAISRFSSLNPNPKSSSNPSVEKEMSRDELIEAASHKEGPISLDSYAKRSGLAVPAPSKEKDAVELDLNKGEAPVSVSLAEDRPIFKGADSMEVVGLSAGCEGDGHEKKEAICNLDPTHEKEAMKREIETKLGGLNEKKHYLVQMLKQILNAEEEIKRRSIQSAAARQSAPLQADAPAHMSFAARNPSKISVDVSFRCDISGETDVTANQTAQGRQWPPMPTPSPSTTPISKTPRAPFHHSTVRSPHGAVPYQATTSSSLMAGLTTSPACFVPATVSVSGTHFAAASSPSPAASAAAFSPFRNFRS
ncbi:hypothetical protein KSP39_PZI006888 [Platanthera zijinensis]|uniref:Uncharacterized protein n=1 Tax=Platanthera zijinensis TaxID=2320716 RepID=A0AAP0BPD2_9ASPA